MNFSLSHKLWALVSKIIHSFGKCSLLSQHVYFHVRLRLDYSLWFIPLERAQTNFSLSHKLWSHIGEIIHSFKMNLYSLTGGVNNVSSYRPFNIIIFLIDKKLLQLRYRGHLYFRGKHIFNKNKSIHLTGLI